MYKIFNVLTLCGCVLQFSLAQDAQTLFRGVVFEARARNSSPDDIFTNLEYYRDKLDALPREPSTIVVFPEYGLTGMQKDPTNFAILIPENHPEEGFQARILKELSAMAYDHDIHLVANLLEKTDEKNPKYYSTSLVFDINGRIIAKYRKINLLDEPKLSRGESVVTFSTEFGKFGLISGSDIIYNNPSQKVFENISVTAVVCTSVWKSAIPFLGALSVQSGYALANGIHLLVSNLNDPANGYGGSGIYSGNNIANSFISGSPSSEILVHQLAQLKSRATCQDLNPKVSPFTPQTIPFGPVDISGYKTALIPLGSFQNKVLNFQEGTKLSESICDGSFCCAFNVSVFGSISEREEYRLVIKSTANNRICSLLACRKGGSLEGCGDRYESKSVFDELSVRTFFKDQTSLNNFRPVTLLQNLHSIERLNYCAGKESAELKVTDKQENVVAFGLYSTNKSSSIFFSSILFVNILSLNVVKYFL